MCEGKSGEGAGGAGGAGVGLSAAARAPGCSLLLLAGRSGVSGPAAPTGLAGIWVAACPSSVGMCAPLLRCGVSARKAGGGRAGGGSAAGAGEGAGCGRGAGAGLALPPTGARDRASAPPLPPRATSSFLPPAPAAPVTRNREPASDA